MLRRLRVSVFVLLWAALLGAGPAPVVVAQSDANQGPLDLAAMVPAPDELPNPGFSLWRGMLLDQHARANLWARADGRDVLMIVASLEAAGWLRTYEATYVVAGDDPTLTDHAVLLAVTQYTDDNAATNQLTDELIPLAENITDVPNAASVGDASAMRSLANVRPPGVDASSGAFQGIQLVFQTGNLVARVIVMDRGETPVEPEQATTIGETFLAHIQEVQTRGGPGLSDLVLRYEGAVEGTFEGYTRIVGKAWRQASQNDEAFATRERNPTQTINTYAYEPEFENALVIVQIATFADAAAAGRALEYLDEQFTTGFVEAGATPVTGGQSFGDASVTIYANDFFGINLYEIGVQLDTVVVSLSVGGVDTPLSTAEVMMAAQLECFQAGSCAGAAPLPQEFSA